MRDRCQCGGVKQKFKKKKEKKKKRRGGGGTPSKEEKRGLSRSHSCQAMLGGQRSGFEGGAKQLRGNSFWVAEREGRKSGGRFGKAQRVGKGII